MGTNAVQRLVQALELLGYQHTKEPHHKSNLIHAIQHHAGLIGDKELEAVCDREIERIKAEIRAAQGPVEVQVNVGDNQRNSGSKLNPGTVQINIGRNQRNCMGDFYE